MVAGGSLEAHPFCYPVVHLEGNSLMMPMEDVMHLVL